MNNNGFAFLLTLVAGFSTMLGTVLIFIKNKDTKKIIVMALAFAAGVMITVSITDLIPESLALLHDNLSTVTTIVITFLGIVLGIIISMLIDYYLPSESKDNNLYKVGFISMLAIILHNIPEGIVTFLAGNSNKTLGVSLALAIAMHNIPEGISISIPIYYSTGSKKKAILYTLISALSEPFGALLAFIFLKKYINDIILGILFSLIAGIMLQISICELIPTARRYNKLKYFYVFFILGIVFMLLKFIF